MKDKVSIIVPIYNVEQYLEKCINSLLNQKYSNIEILLVDDCATDNSAKIAKKFEKIDDRCIYIKREKNGGLSAARNSGIKNSTGDYICFVDSDDWVSDDFVLHFLEKAKKYNCEIVVCDYMMVNSKGNEVLANTLVNLTDESDIKEKVAYIRNHACTKFFKRSFWNSQNLMFPEDIKRGEDMCITIPLLTRAKNIGILNEPLYYYYQRENSLSNKKNKKVDLSFYTKTFELLLDNAKDKYKLEIEYHGIIEMIYGKTMLMINNKCTNKEIRDHFNYFKQKFPNWKRNPYINKTQFLKKVFIKIAGLRLIAFLRIMVMINEKRK